MDPSSELTRLIARGDRRGAAALLVQHHAQARARLAALASAV